ncbi:glycosyltransferase family 2 protein [Gammaproteobacteria bacterium]|nr:glycosyltransferase family 2 protein [Gammaproteobacteria bacterium]
MHASIKNLEEIQSPLITIITVVKDGKDVIQETMSSVFSQEYKNIEYIVVDGRSTDGTFEIIHRNKDKIDLLICEDDDGIYPAMNKGINAANGLFTGFLNASDLLYPDAILNLVDGFNQNDFDFSLGPAQIEDLKTGHITISKPLTSFSIKGGQYTGMPSPHLAIYMKTKLIKELGMFDTKFKLSADYDLMLRAVSADYKPWYFNKPVGVFRLGGVSGSFKTQIENFSILKRYKIPLYKLISITGRSILALIVKKILTERIFNRLKSYLIK